MKINIENTTIIIKQKLNRSKELEDNYRNNPLLHNYHIGKRQAFEESLQLINNILKQWEEIEK